MSACCSRTKLLTSAGKKGARVRNEISQNGLVLVLEKPVPLAAVSFLELVRAYIALKCFYGSAFSRRQPSKLFIFFDTFVHFDPLSYLSSVIFFLQFFFCSVSWQISLQTHNSSGAPGGRPVFQGYVHLKRESPPTPHPPHPRRPWPGWRGGGGETVI